MTHGAVAVVGERLHALSRTRLQRPDGDRVEAIEQNAHCTVQDGRIATVDLPYSGFRPLQAG